MTLIEERLNDAYKKGLITYYDYGAYKSEGKQAKYDGEFVNKLPNLYFLGCPIKDIIMQDWSNGRCHVLSIAIGLCFGNFKVITCNLKDYNDFLKSRQKDRHAMEYEHSFALVELDGKQVVIDPVFCMITDYDTYKYIFGMVPKFSFDKKKLESTEPIRFIIEHLNEQAPDISKRNEMPEKEMQFKEKLRKYIDLCKNYENVEDFNLQSFIRKYLLPTSQEMVIDKWRVTSYNKNKLKKEPASFLDKDLSNSNDKKL